MLTQKGNNIRVETAMARGQLGAWLFEVQIFGWVKRDQRIQVARSRELAWIHFSALVDPWG